MSLSDTMPYSKSKSKASNANLLASRWLNEAYVVAAMLFTKTISRSASSPVERPARLSTRTSAWAMSKPHMPFLANLCTSTYEENAPQRRSWRCHFINVSRGAIHCALVDIDCTLVGIHCSLGYHTDGHY